MPAGWGSPLGGVCSRLTVAAVSVSTVSHLLASATVVGVSGSRQPAPGCARAVRRALRQLAPDARVVTGCAPGIDATARRAAPAAVVVQASAFTASGVPHRAALARRSVAIVRHVAAAGPLGLWLSAPGRGCPPGLVPSASPSACFSGAGSGSWASLALALGLGVRALVWLPSGVAPPAAWPLAVVGPERGGAWWDSTVSPQGSLF